MPEKLSEPIAKCDRKNHYPVRSHMELPPSCGDASSYRWDMKFVNGSRNSIIRDPHELKLRKDSVQKSKAKPSKETTAHTTFASSDTENCHHTDWNFDDELTAIRELFLPLVCLYYLLC